MFLAARLLLLALALSALAAAPAAARPGAVDTGFGQGGVALTSFGGERNSDVAWDVLVLGDGRIVAAGTVDSDDGPVGFGLARYLPSGQLDTSFGDGGRVITRPVPMLAGALARQADGRLLVGGTACEGSTCDMAVARYSPDGVLDGSFGDGGIARVPFAACGPDAAKASVADLAVQPDGAIVAAGSACPGDTYGDVAAMRLRPDGGLDSSFGDGGRVSFDLGPQGGVARGVAIDGEGRIVLAGELETDGAVAVIVRLTPAGARDGSFDGDGVRTLKPVPDASSAYDVGVLADGRIVFAGVAIFGGVTDGWFVTRLRPDGSEDASFDGDGTALLRGRTVTSLAMVTAPDGGATLAGSRCEEGRPCQIGAARFTAAGALDPAFGSGGITVVPAGTESVGRAIAQGPNGSLAIAGSAGDPESRYTFAVTRLLGSEGTAGPPPGAGPRPALRIPVRSASRIRLRRDGTFRLALGPFTEAVTGRVEMLRGPRVFARRDFRAARAGVVRVRLRASARVRRLAARRGGVRVVARITARDATARLAARRFTFRLVRR